MSKYRGNLNYALSIISQNTNIPIYRLMACDDGEILDTATYLPVAQYNSDNGVIDIY